MSTGHTNNSLVSDWMIWVQSICFSVLYTIWALPETILIRHVCLIVGAIIGLYEIYQFRAYFLKKNSIPIWLLIILFIWISFHLFFISKNFSLQIYEYITLWKRVLLGAIFAFGFGIALANNKLDDKRVNIIQAIFYFGLLGPTFIYFIKYFLVNFGMPQGWTVPHYWQLYYSSSPYYVPKTAYVNFCLPALAVSIGLLYINLKLKNFFTLTSVIFLASASAILFIFFNEKIKNGIIYSFIVLSIFMVTAYLQTKKCKLFNLIFISFVTGVIASLFWAHNQNVDLLRVVVADAKIAWETGSYDAWKLGANFRYPRNELGLLPSETIYLRIAWAKIGYSLIESNPLGYGLIEQSFGHLAALVWPESKLHQSHSGWIDLALGIGLPGLFLVVGSLLISIFTFITVLLIEIVRFKTCGEVSKTVNWHIILFSALGISFLMWFTSEISQKVFFDSLIFWISIAAGMLFVKKIAVPHNFCRK